MICYSDLRLRLTEEKGAIRRAKDFLKRQKHQQHQQKSALEDAKTEWRRDLRHGYEENGDPGKGSTMIYEDVRLGLERVRMKEGMDGGMDRREDGGGI